MTPTKRSRIPTLCLLLTLAMFLIAAFPTGVLAGPPIVKIKVAEFPKSLLLQMEQGGTWKLGSASGRLNKKDRCEITGVLETHAKKRFHVMVESLPMREPLKVAESLAKWRATGRAVHTFQAGSLSHSYDGRVLFIGVGQFDTRESAQKLSDELSAKTISNWIFEEILSRSKGKIAISVNGRRVARGSGPLSLSPTPDVAIRKVEFARGYSWHGYADRRFRGPITIGWGAQDALDCVLTTNLEHILAGVVPSEISSNAAPGAIQTQAIAARGEILSKMSLRHIGEGFHFCSEQHCQVYSGDDSVSEKIAVIIAPTAGYLLQSAKADIIDAVYAANCGGHGDRNDLVWTSPPDPYLIGVWDCAIPPALDLTNETDVASFIRNPPQCFCQDPTVEGGDKFRWTRNLSAADWKKVESAAGVGPIRSIDDFARGPSGRLYKITLHGKTGDKSVMKELKIRQLFGGLRSACFIVAWKRDSAGFISGAEFMGAGWGHGVGMCQTGAQYLAREGWDYGKILSHYFPGSRLVKWY
ncbi:hypothetical protein AUK22_11020 [bacterium CG2_30_54_10]|nr:MAG: hypothetical protein AUK22_11020 [bacterium CG2_30_54_10]